MWGYLCLTDFCPIITAYFGIMELGSICFGINGNKNKYYCSKMKKISISFNDHAETFLGHLSISVLIIKQHLRSSIEYSSHTQVLKECKLSVLTQSVLVIKLDMQVQRQKSQYANEFQVFNVSS